MRNFLRAILNEWKQHWRLLLILFTVYTLFMALKIIEVYGNVLYLTLVILCCYIPVAMTLNLLANSIKPLSPCSAGMLYCEKFIAGLIPFIITMASALWCFTERADYLILHQSFITFLYIGLGIYVLIFFIALLMTETRRPVALCVSILAALLLFILLVPGIMAGIALFGTDSLIHNIIDKIAFFMLVKGRGQFVGAAGYLIGLGATLFFTPCIIILPALGCLFCMKKVSSGNKYTRLMLLAAGVFVLISIILCISAEITGHSRLVRSIRDAQAVGLLYASGQILPPDAAYVSAERNSAVLYKKASLMFEKLKDQTGDDYYYLSGAPNSLYSQERNQRLMDFIQSPEGRHVYELIDKAAACPDCFYIQRPIKMEILDSFAYDVYKLSHFILARARFFKLNGNEDKILPEIEKSLRIESVINSKQYYQSSSTGRTIIENTIAAAIAIGPENQASVTSYRRMFDYLNSRPINYLYNGLEHGYDYNFRMLNFQCSFDDGENMYHNYSNFSRGVIWLDLLVGYPLVLRNFADHIDTCIKVRREMLKIREMPVLTPELSGLLNDYSTYDDYNYLLRTSLRSLFEFRSAQAMFKIGLALKIYKCEHGKYPASLQELVPAILPEIPVDPLDGKPFGYKVKDGNFTLTNNAKYPKELSSELKGAR